MPTCNIRTAHDRRTNLSAAPPKLAAVTSGQGSDVVLLGHLTWSDKELSWITDWQMDFQGGPHRWQMRGVTFDEAFRRGLGGAAQIPSGNGGPG